MWKARRACMPVCIEVLVRAAVGDIVMITSPCFADDRLAGLHSASVACVSPTHTDAPMFHGATYTSARPDRGVREHAFFTNVERAAASYLATAAPCCCDNDPVVTRLDASTLTRAGRLRSPTARRIASTVRLAMTRQLRTRVQLEPMATDDWCDMHACRRIYYART